MTLNLILPYALFYSFLIFMCSFKRDRIFPIAILFIVTAIFIGLRFETAFDWTVYKGEFRVLHNSRFTISNTMAIARDFNHELGFVFISSFFAHIFKDYEIFQLIIYSLFFCSLLVLFKSLKSKWFSAQFFIIASFLLFTLMMSTLRQCLAIAFVNFAFSAALNRRFSLAVILFIAAISSHLSSSIYIAIFLSAYFGRIGGGKTTFIYGMALSLTAYFLLFIIARVNLPIISKLSMYLSRDFDSNIYEQALFLVTNMIMLFYSAREIKTSGQTGKIICRYIIISSAMSIGLLDINTIRNRIFYESVIVFVVFLFSRIKAEKFILIYGVAALGLISFVSSFVRQSRIAFLPYQSYISYALYGYQGTGYERQAEIYRLQRQANLR